MNDIEKTTEYIKYEVIDHLERLMNGGSSENTGSWYTKYPRCGIPKKDDLYKGLLHDMMIPYYEKYLYGDITLCKANMESIRWQMKYAIDDDDQFGRWASGQDLIISAEGWGDNMKRIPEGKRIYQYFYVLEALLQADCEYDWSNLAEKLKEMLFKSEVYSDYKTDEVLCVLHAFTMIMLQEWPKQKKSETLTLLRQQWLFMKHYYSVMTRHIIGVKWTKFRKVAETVMTSSQSFKPHMHIFYSGLMDCADELRLSVKEQRALDKVMVQMQEEITRHEPSELLYELCDVIFPEDFQRMLREHRPRSYKEIEEEGIQKDELIKQLQDQTVRTRKELEKSKDIIEQMVVKSIPIENIDKELEQYPAGIAWEMLKELNANVVISMQKAWRRHFPTLLAKYRARLMEPIQKQKDLTDAMMKVAERPTYGTYYESGSNHDDKRNQVFVKDKKNHVPQIKQLDNE